MGATRAFGDYVRAGLFQPIWGCVKYLPTPFGDVLRYLVLKVFMKAIRTVWIRSGVTIWWPDRIRLGRCSLNEDLHLNGYGGITVGDHVLIGHRTTLFSDEHVFDAVDRPIWFQGRRPAPIVIENDVYLGCNVVVLAGVTIGRGAVVGAGSIVTRNVPAFAVVVGSPARVLYIRGSGPPGPIGSGEA